MASICNTFQKSVRDKNSVTYNFCHSKVHLKCNYLNYVDFQYVKYSTKEWWCIKCYSNLFPFTQLYNYKLFSLFRDQSFCNTDFNENCLVLNPSKNLPHLFNELYNFIPNPNNNPENLVNCKYYDISQVKNLETCDDNKYLSPFHLNTSMLMIQNQES